MKKNAAGLSFCTKMKKHLLSLAEKFKSSYTGRWALVTNVATAGVMGCIADATAQVAEKKYFGSSEPWDYTRTRNMTIISTAFGPLVYYWYHFLDTRFPGKAPPIIVKKVVVDLLIAPVWYGVYIGGLCLLKNSSLENALKEYKAKAPLLITADLMMWPILQTFNFVFFPPYYRIIGMKLNEIVMGIFTSHLVNNEYSAEEIIASIANINNDVCRDDIDDSDDKQEKILLKISRPDRTP